MTTPRRLPLTLSEADFQRTVIDLAIISGWRVCHQRPAQTARGWRTAVEGHAGLPDLILARDGVVLLAELKRQRQNPTPDQKAWLAAAGSRGRLWRPQDWPEIVSTLTGRTAA